MTGLASEAVAGLEELALLEILRQRLVKPVFVPAPAAGAEWAASVPGGCVWELLGVQAALAASAVVANRQPTIIARDPDSNQVARFGTGNALAASSAATYEWWAGMGTTSSQGPSMSCLPSPPFLLLPGWSLRSSTGSLDVADQYSSIVLSVREWSLDQVRLQAEWIGRQYA